MSRFVILQFLELHAWLHYMISHVFSITPDVSSAVLVRRPGLFYSPPWRGPGPSR